MIKLNVAVKNKIAINSGTLKHYVCGNSDYVVVFDFDAEWNERPIKTARFKYNAQYIDVVFEGNEVAIPIITNTPQITVGVYAGDLACTTPAVIPTRGGVLCGDGAPADPQEDVYNQIIEQINSGQLKTDAKVAQLKEYIDSAGGGGMGGGTAFMTDETLYFTDGILGVNTAQEPDPDNTLPITAAAVAQTVGNIEILLKTI